MERPTQGANRAGGVNAVAPPKVRAKTLEMPSILKAEDADPKTVSDPIFQSPGEKRAKRARGDNKRADFKHQVEKDIHLTSVAQGDNLRARHAAALGGAEVIRPAADACRQYMMRSCALGAYRSEGDL